MRQAVYRCSWVHTIADCHVHMTHRNRWPFEFRSWTECMSPATGKRGSEWSLVHLYYYRSTTVFLPLRRRHVNTQASKQTLSNIKSRRSQLRSFVQRLGNTWLHWHDFYKGGLKLICPSNVERFVTLRYCRLSSIIIATASN